MTKLEKLNKQIKKLQEEKESLEYKEFLKSPELKAAESKVGKFFRYKNSYSCPEKESDYWYLYSYVKRIDYENCNANFIRFYVDSFQIDKNGQVNIENEKWTSESCLGEEVNNHQEIKDVLVKIYQKCMGIYMKIPVN